MIETAASRAMLVVLSTMKTLLTFSTVLTFALASALAQETPPALEFLLQALAKSEEPATQLNLLRGINKAMEGRRGVAAPAEWEGVATKLAQSPSPEVREQVQMLGAVFGSSRALESMRKVLVDPAAAISARQQALESLVATRDKDTLPLLLDLLKQASPLRQAALRGLTAFDDARIPEAILSGYAGLSPDERRDALATLLTRESSAKALVAGLAAGQVPVSDLAVPQVRQLKAFKEPAIQDWLKAHPALTITASDKQAEIQRYKQLLTQQVGDVYRGRALFAQTCAVCHKLFDAGADIGPELTGANRSDLDYLLQNVVDPNAMIGKDYQSTTIETKDGQMLVGLLRGEDAQALTLKTLASTVIVPRTDVKTLTVSDVSMMPEGLLAPLKPEQVRDLFTYLSSQHQVPMLITATNAGSFFDGRDFAGWRKSSDAWTIAESTIIGHGNAQRPESLMSEMIAADFKLSAQIKVTGEKAVAEIVLRGRSSESAFVGFSASLGGPTPSNLWIYFFGQAQPALTGPTVPLGEWVPLEIEATGTRVRMSLGGKEAFAFSAPVREPRTIPAFYLFGKDAELAIKDLKIEVAP